MDSLDRKVKIDAALRSVISLLENIQDGEVPELLGDGILDDFMEAIAKPLDSKYRTAYDYLLANKNRLQLLTLMRLAITQRYSIPHKVNSHIVFVSPTEMQWYQDGVMFVQGQDRFQGLIGLYQGGRVMFGIAARAAQEGEKLGKDDFLFLEPDEAQRRSQQASVPRTPGGLDQALKQLDNMLADQEASEAAWQKYFTNNPWILGLEYKQCVSHTALDDKQIPDFTGVRAHDSALDIIEIKPPTTPLFRQNDDFRAEFHKAWSQAERYLEFTRQETDYLRRQKGLNFDNPYCYLIAGYNLSPTQIKAVNIKQRLNPAIRFRTFNDVRAIANNTVSLIKQLLRVMSHDEENT